MDPARPTDVAFTASRVRSARPRITLRAALLLAVVASLPGCHRLRPAQPALQGTLPAPRAVAETAAGTQPRLLAKGWRCEDGRILGTRVLPGLKTVELRIDNLRRIVPQVASASGARFENPDWLFWNRGAQAMLQRKPGPPVYCHEVHALLLVEDARARGITFRGQGGIPGWLLEVGPDNRVVLSGAPGNSTFDDRLEWSDLAPAPGPVYGSTRYTAQAGGRRHVILVLPDPCVDELSGARFPSAVLVGVDGRRMRGCGTPIAP